VKNKKRAAIAAQIQSAEIKAQLASTVLLRQKHYPLTDKLTGFIPEEGGSSRLQCNSKV